MTIVEEIMELKEKRNAIILAHNYQLPEVQDIADFVGDSLGLSLEAAQTKAEVIVFCGVHFMAETAKILSPEKIVLLPEKKAGCPMADMITGEELLKLKREHPKAKVLSYVNTSAEVKALSDLCCTSANAVQMVQEGLRGEKEIIFVPDRYLADYVAQQTHRSLIIWPGFCPTHACIKPEQVIHQKHLHPEAEVLVHPECPAEIISLADRVASTEGMCRYVQSSQAREFIIVTEEGIIHRMRRENPGKFFYPLSPPIICPTMKETTLSKVRDALTYMVHQIEVPPDIIEKARRAITGMLQTKRGD
jgi:quinolinate synthase